MVIPPPCTSLYVVMAVGFCLVRWLCAADVFLKSSFAIQGLCVGAVVVECV